MSRGLASRDNRDRHSPRRARDRAAVPGTAGRRGTGLPPGPSADGRTAPRIGRALRLVRQQRRRPERSVRGREGLVGGAGCDLGRARHRRWLLLRVPRDLHDHLHLPVPPQRHRQAEAGVGERADARRGRALAGRLGAGDEHDLALGDRCRRHRRRSPARPKGSPPGCSGRAMPSDWPSSRGCST